MDDVQCIPYRQTAYFSKLICDYLDENEGLNSFYGYNPTLANFRKQIDLKSSFSSEARQILVKSLRSQYQRLKSPQMPFDNVEDNIRRLEEPTTYTVTTGHQLSLFTGPLYFIYKIVSTIKLADKLKEAYPEFHFVPVYWMASEDHDFAEINHINLESGRLNWGEKAGGPVGRMKTASLHILIDELKDILGPGANAGYLTDLLKRSYTGQENLAEATRYLVHELFADKGLVIIDGDDVVLKRQFIPFFKGDLLDHLPFTEVTKTGKRLAKEYFEQVNAREVNLFYIGNSLRERIERKGDKWVVLNTDITFSRSELEKELEEHPERFSPNVILRPLYQEVVLPNLSYTGGGGELAYWLQLKGMFDHWNIAFPILVLRNSVLWISPGEKEKLEKLGLQLTDLFKKREELKSLFARAKAPVDPELKPYREKIEEVFDQLEEVAHLTDKSMLGAVNAQRQKQLNGLDNLRKKLLRAEKRKHKELMERIERLHERLFPGQGLQERHDNFLFYYREYGEDFLQTLFRNLDPLLFQFCIIEATGELEEKVLPADSAET